METNEWKTAWQALNARLEKLEMLEERTIRQMLYNKSGKSLGKLINFEILSLLIVLPVIPTVFYAIHLLEIKAQNPLVAEILPFMKIIFGICAVVCILYIPWEIYKVNKLMKVDFAGNISENRRIISLYDIWTKRERLGSLISVPVTLAWAVYTYAKLQMPLAIWIFMICIFAGVLLFLYYYYRKIYYPSINAIRKSLDELQELDDK